MAVVSRHVAVADDVAQVGGAFVQHEEVLERFFGDGCVQGASVGGGAATRTDCTAVPFGSLVRTQLDLRERTQIGRFQHCRRSDIDQQFIVDGGTAVALPSLQDHSAVVNLTLECILVLHKLESNRDIFPGGTVELGGKDDHASLGDVLRHFARVNLVLAKQPAVRVAPRLNLRVVRCPRCGDGGRVELCWVAKDERSILLMLLEQPEKRIGSSEGGSNLERGPPFAELGGIDSGWGERRVERV